MKTLSRPFAATCLLAFGWLACAPSAQEAVPEDAAAEEAATRESKDIILATTTSTQDSGMLDVLLPVFQAATGYRVKTIAVGTGEALAMGRRGDADVVLAHAPDLEMESIEGGFTINRRLIMHNDFIVIGPVGDPAGVRGLSDAAKGLSLLVASGSAFVSRGDNSGTHFREKSLWEAAGVDPAGDWYAETGQGMGATLMIANERQAYTLTDRGTYLAFKDKLDLEPMIVGDPLMLNIYSVMEVNPEKFEHVNHPGARAFADFLLSDEAQALIEEHGVEKFGEPLFFADAGKEESDLTG